MNMCIKTLHAAILNKMNIIFIITMKYNKERNDKTISYLSLKCANGGTPLQMGFYRLLGTLTAQKNKYG